MITNSIFNQKLIATIKERISQKSLQVKLLTDVALLGKEAAYRRLRGEIPFSFAEACIISRHLGISLDNISDVAVRNDRPVFELRTLPQDNIIDNHSEYYNGIVAGEHEWFEQSLHEGSTQYVMAAYNTIPHALFFPYPNLSRFRIFKMAYQMQSHPRQDMFSRIAIPDNMNERLKKVSDKVRSQTEMTFILGRQVFTVIVSQIQFFYGLNLLTPEDVEKLKGELLDMISDMEKFATYGKTSEGKNVWIYLSNIDFEDNYTYAKSNNSERAFLDIYQMYSLVSTDPSVCEMQRKWIESLRKYSTLISVSGERERNLFFDKQRKIIGEL